MLQSFLSQNKLSLVHNSQNPNQQPLAPSLHLLKQPCCLPSWQIDKKSPPSSQSTIPESNPTLPRSPTYKRKKIFEVVSASQSKKTAEFKSIALQESKVEAYKMPTIQQQIHEPKLAVKKKKATKQNGLYLTGKDLLGLKKNYMKSMETLPSTLNQIMPESNQQIGVRQPIREMINKAENTDKKSLQSLEVREGEIQIFTFQTSQNPSFSLEYSETEPYSGTHLPYR